LGRVQRNLVFHAGCPDGFGAAWAAWRAWGDDARYIARGHDDAFDPQRFDGQIVVFADISLRNPVLLEVAKVSAQLVVLDHHLTARDHFASDPAVENAMAAQGHSVHFDLNHSGAVLSWNYFHPGEPPPDLLRYVEDQDLWNWKLPQSHEVNAAIGSYNREFGIWSELAERTSEELALEGAPIVRANQIEVKRALKQAHPVAIGNERIEAVNALHQRAATGHELAKRKRFGKEWGLVYRMSGAMVDCSIYSVGDLDVSAVATRLGGGGHRNAAGFSVSLADWLAHFA
jgi:oligoribonuclease NrnB/cAMP/cGMP phosphodiesterase (DHH superfamily)